MLRMPIVPAFIQGALARHLGERTGTLQRWAANVHERGQDIEVGRNAKLILTAPDGGRWAVTVDNTGTLVVTAETTALLRRTL
jgi:hypothetical protein